MQNEQQEILKKLEHAFDLDQNAIKGFKNGAITLDDLRKIQQSNLEYAQNILKGGFFPFKDLTSDKAYKSLFLTVQHSDTIELMRYVAGIIQKAQPHQVDKSDYAYLIDRIRIFEGKPQLFGTQFRKKNGVVSFFDIENSSEIDSRRAELGMEPFEEYRKKTEKY